METRAMSDPSIAIPAPPTRHHRLPEIRVALLSPPESCRRSAMREACLVGGFALAFCWVAAELAIVLGMR
jgi:hypothetical protein